MARGKRSRSKRSGNKSKTSLSRVYLFGIVGVAGAVTGIILIAFFLSFIPGGTVGPGTTTTTTSTGKTGTIETLTWDIFTDDKWAGGSADCAVAIYDPTTHNEVESGETGSDGQWTTSKYYTSDDIYDFKFGNGTFCEYWVLGIEVPRFSGTVISGATHKSYFDVVDQGTFSLEMEFSNTTVSREDLSNAGNYNQTVSGNSPTFHFTILNSEVDSGFISSINPILEMDCNAVLEVYVTGTNYQDVDWTTNYEDKNDGAQQSWFIPVEDLEITFDKDSKGKTVYDGQIGFNADFDLSGLSGDTVDLYIRLILGASIDYLDSHSSLPSSSYAYTYTTSMYVNLVD